MALKAVLNKGISLDLSKALPNIIPILRPEVPMAEIINPIWLAGFVLFFFLFFFILNIIILYSIVFF